MKRHQTKRSVPECHTKAISFKTKRGRVIKFMGRKGGADKCGKHPLSAAQRSVRKAFAKVARKCNKVRKSVRGVCWKGAGKIKATRFATKRKSSRSYSRGYKASRRSSAARRVDTSICDSFKDAVRRKLCLENLRRGRVLLPG